MASRTEGPDPPQRSANLRTCADVDLWLEAAFRTMPSTPIYAPRGSTLQAAAGAEQKCAQALEG